MWTYKEMYTMTKSELLDALNAADIGDDQVIVVADEMGGWDNIERIGYAGEMPAIIFGGGNPFSDE